MPCHAMPCHAMSLSKFSRRDDSSPSSSDSELECLLSKIKRPRVRKRLFRPSSAVITVGSDSSSDGDFKAYPEIGAHNTKDKVIKLTFYYKIQGVGTGQSYPIQVAKQIWLEGGCSTAVVVLLNGTILVTVDFSSLGTFNFAKKSQIVLR